MIAEQGKVLVDDDSFMDWETRHHSIPFYRHVIAGTIMFPLPFPPGSCAGIMEHVGMFPLDTIKVSELDNQNYSMLISRMFSSFSVDSSTG